MSREATARSEGHPAEGAPSACEHLNVKEDSIVAYGSRLWTRDNAAEAPTVGDFDIADEDTGEVTCLDCGEALDSNFLVTGEAPDA